MLKLLLAITLIAAPMLSCTIPPGTRLPTIEEQVRYSGAIIRGTVASMTGDANKSSVTLKNAVFYRGAGPTTVNVAGYTNSALCGISAPEVNTEIFVFVCRTGQTWTLNNIGISTGSVVSNDANTAIIESRTVNEVRTEGAEFIQYMRCLSMPASLLVVNNPSSVNKIAVPTNNTTATNTTTVAPTTTTTAPTTVVQPTNAVVASNTTGTVNSKDTVNKLTSSLTDMFGNNFPGSSNALDKFKTQLTPAK